MGPFKKILTLLMLSPLSLPLTAAEITLDGKALKDHEAQYLKASVTITSQCYPSQHSLLNAVRGSSSEVKNAMVAHLDTSPESMDKVEVEPGFTTRETKTTYDPNTRKHVTLCKNGWHSTTTLTIELSDPSKWSSLQLDILNIVDKYNEETRDSSTQTNMRLSAPKPGLYPETVKMLEKEAKLAALTDAYDTYNLLADRCGLSNGRIVKIQPTGFSSPMPMPRRSANTSTDGRSVPELNPSFGNLSVHASWQVTWEFDDEYGRGCHDILLQQNKN